MSLKPAFKIRTALNNNKLSILKPKKNITIATPLSKLYVDIFYYNNVKGILESNIYIDNKKNPINIYDIEIDLDIISDVDTYYNLIEKINIYEGDNMSISNYKLIINNKSILAFEYSKELTYIDMNKIYCDNIKDLIKVIDRNL